MPRSEVEAIFDRIQKVLNKIDSGLVATLCGAYRDELNSSSSEKNQC
jgi:hypothetical protein